MSFWSSLSVNVSHFHLEDKLSYKYEKRFPTPLKTVAPNDNLALQRKSMPGNQLDIYELEARKQFDLDIC